MCVALGTFHRILYIRSRFTVFVVCVFWFECSMDYNNKLFILIINEINKKK